MSSKATAKTATTVKVAAQTGAAKDEMFSAISEDNSSNTLNILANDPGAARLWSLNQSALQAAAGSQLAENLAAITLASGARVSVNADGTVNYVAGEALQSLREGELFTDSFIYTIRMANGALSTATASVGVVGKNDLASISGDNSGSLQEDGEQSIVSGTLQVADVDRGENRFGSTSSLDGQHGTFSFDLQSGAWTYTLNNDSAAVQALGASDVVYDTLQVVSLDGTASETITVTITGANEAGSGDDDSSAGIKYTINKNNITGQGLGLVDSFEAGKAEISGFTTDDVLHIANAVKSYAVAAPVLTDVNSDGALDTVLVISYNEQGNVPATLTVALLGFVDFTDSNWF